MDARRAADMALHGYGGQDLLNYACFWYLDRGVLLEIGEAKARKIMDADEAPNEGYLVEAARNAMWDAFRRFQAIDRSRSPTPEEQAFYTRLHLGYTLPPGRKLPRRELGLSQDGLRRVNEILTPKERRVVDGVREGKTQAEIAKELGHRQPWISKLFRRSIEKLTEDDHPELQSLGTRLQTWGRETRRGAS